jgi:hypothetical protein
MGNETAFQALSRHHHSSAGTRRNRIEFPWKDQIKVKLRICWWSPAGHWPRKYLQISRLRCADLQTSAATLTLQLQAHGGHVARTDPMFFGVCEAVAENALDACDSCQTWRFCRSCIVTKNAGYANAIASLISYPGRADIDWQALAGACLKADELDSYYVSLGRFPHLVCSST